ncbi:MAG: FHA domain-containing protein, partial [Phycisphaeraceae bacterium]|nr:FHA domain-containing protein [Phycisphaeraceae bacterium]
MPTYQLASTDGRGYLVPLTQGPVTIGRNKDNVLCIADESASRYHCVIEPDGSGGFRVRDLGSRNGTKINANRLVNAASEVVPGDTIKVGGHSFTIEAEMSIGEVRHEVRSRTIDVDKAWLEELKGMLEALPPKGEGDEQIVMVDGSGQATPALSGTADGPRAVRLLLLLAAKSRATDIHVEPKQHRYNVRIRVDGQMVQVAELPEKVGELCLGLVRTACLMRPEARDAVQDGHFSVKFRSRR